MSNDPYTRLEKINEAVAAVAGTVGRIRTLNATIRQALKRGAPIVGGGARSPMGQSLLTGVGIGAADSIVDQIVGGSPANPTSKKGKSFQTKDYVTGSVRPGKRTEEQDTIKQLRTNNFKPTGNLIADDVEVQFSNERSKNEFQQEVENSGLTTTTSTGPRSVSYDDSDRRKHIVSALKRAMKQYQGRVQKDASK